MADVTGSIGNEYVELNNAATEATLRLLLQATLASSKGQKDAIKDMVTKAGLDPAAVAAANTGLNNVGRSASTSVGAFNKLGAATSLMGDSFDKLDKSVSPLVNKLLQGTASASDAFDALSKLPGPAGKVADLFSRLASFQEKNMDMYQKITDAGVGLGGNLTSLRQAALDTYMTLDQYTNLMKTSGESLAKMGGTADQGAKAFNRLSNDIMSSDAGRSLLALGYTTEQVNTGLVNYLANTGARTRQEMQDTAKLTAGATEYLTQLDALATITGKSREEQEKALKQANQNAAYEQMKMGMTEAQRKAYDQGLAEMSAKFGKAGEDLFKSQAMGLPPMTEAAQKLQALSPEVARASQSMTEVGKRGGTLAEQQALSAQATEGAVQAAGRFKGVAGALSMQGGATGEALMGLTKESNRARAQGTETTEAGRKQQAEIRKAQAEREASQAKEMAATNKAMQEMGQSINKLITPIIDFLTPVMTKLAQGMAGLLKIFENLGTVVTGSILIGLTALGAYLLKLRAQKALEAATGGGPGRPGGVLGKLGSSPTNPMFVKVIGSITAPGSSSGGGSKGGKGIGKLGGLGLGLAGGIAGDMAADALGRDTTAGKTADVLGTAASFAGMGAMLGPLGALAGGLAGAGYGAYKNFFSDAPKMANGGVVTQPTMVQAGEAGSEAIVPLHHLESLKTELQTLNNQTIEMLKHMRGIDDNTRRTFDATKSLKGDLFKF
jgi:hypothetical protein